MKNEVMMRFPTSLYSLTALQQAAVDYEAICDIAVDVLMSRQGDECKYITCIFAHSKAELDLTVKEFCNYVIEQMNARRA